MSSAVTVVNLTPEQIGHAISMYIRNKLHVEVLRININIDTQSQTDGSITSALVGATVETVE